MTSTSRLDLVHLAAAGTDRVWTAPFRTALCELGELTIVEQGLELTDPEAAALLREHQVVLLGWGSRPLPAELAQDRGRIEYLCGYTGTMRHHVPPELLDAGLLLSNWGDMPADGVAEGALTLLLTVLKDLPATIDDVRSGGWNSTRWRRGWLTDARVGLYGCGAIGRRFCELLEPFHPHVVVFDPFAAEVPPGTQRCDSLDELFDYAEIIVIHAGWTPETERSVTAERLARLPDGGVVINTARGSIVDQRALFAELETGRLRAGLDVLRPDDVDAYGPDWLDAGHPARQWTNLVMSGHTIEERWWPPADPEELSRIHEYCIANLERFAAGAEPRFVMDARRFARST